MIRNPAFRERRIEAGRGLGEGKGEEGVEDVAEVAQDRETELDFRRLTRAANCELQFYSPRLRPAGVTFSSLLDK